MQSILGQTYTNFELIILSFSPIDEQILKIIDAFQDPRIRHIRGLTGYLPEMLNRGIDESKGKYIARMDADDISLPHRLEREVVFMEKNSHVDILGAWAKTFGAKIGTIKHPTSHDEIKANLIFQSSFVHPTVIFRKSFLDKHNLRYDDSLKRSEDIDMWVRASEFARFANLSEILVLYRRHAEQATGKDTDLQNTFRERIKMRQFAKLSVDVSPRELAIHQMVCAFKTEGTKEFLSEVGKLFTKIAEANRHTHVYNQTVLENLLGEKWFTVCYISIGEKGRMSWKTFYASPISKWFKKNPRNVLRLCKFLYKSMLA